MLDVGAQVEKYEVLAHLGGGGFADVYKARATSTSAPFMD